MMNLVVVYLLPGNQSRTFVGTQYFWKSIGVERFFLGSKMKVRFRGK